MPSKNKKKINKNNCEILHYTFLFKKGDYFQVSRALEDEYPDFFTGSGTTGYSGGSEFDCAFSCTKQQKEQIKNFISKKWPKLKFRLEVYHDGE